MLPYYGAYAVVLLGCIPGLLVPKSWKKSVLILTYFSIFLFLVSFAAFRASSVDHDYSNYVGWFQTIQSSSLTVADFTKDPAFAGISVIVAWAHGSYPLVACIFATLALGLKWLLSRLTGRLELIPLFVYLEFCRFFLVQEMTAIRAAVAIPLVSLSIFFAIRKRKGLAWTTFVAAFCFHASILLALPVLLYAMFGSLQRRRVFVYLAIAIAIGFLCFRGILEYFSSLERITDYLNDTQEITNLRLFSVYVACRVLVSVTLVLLFWQKMSQLDRFIVFASVFGLGIEFLFSSNSVLALRSSEVFGMFDLLMFLIPLKLLRWTTWLVYCLGLLAIGGLFFNSSLGAINQYTLFF